MKTEKQQPARKQSPLHTLQTNLLLLQPSVSSTDLCKAHQSREPAVTARGSYWGITSLELGPAPWVLPGQGQTGGDKHLPCSAWVHSFQCSPEHCSSYLQGEHPVSTASCHQSQCSACRGWHRPVFPEKQPRSRWAQSVALSKWYTIWTRSLWSQTTRTRWCLAQECTENSKNHHLLQWQWYPPAALCAGVRWALSCSEHKARVQHAQLQYPLEILPWGWLAGANRTKPCLLLTPRVSHISWLRAHTPFYLLCSRLQPTLRRWEPNIYCMKTPTHDNQPRSVLRSRQLLPFKLISLTN